MSKHEGLNLYFVTFVVDNYVDKLWITCGKPVDKPWISTKNLYNL
jgi:hypothetical protein